VESSGDFAKDTSVCPSPRFTPRYNAIGVAGTALTDSVSYMQILGTITDPFLAVHAHSAILPKVPLKLPLWTTQAALERMVAFWHVEPLVVPVDVLTVWDGAGAVRTDGTLSVTPVAVSATKSKLMLAPSSPILRALRRGQRP